MVSVSVSPVPDRTSRLRAGAEGGGGGFEEGRRRSSVVSLDSLSGAGVFCMWVYEERGLGVPMPMPIHHRRGYSEGAT